VEDIADELNQKEDHSKDIAEKAVNNPQLISILLNLIFSDVARIKFRSIKVLNIVSGENPEILYPHADFFIELLDNGNKVIMWNAMDILANLSAVDSQEKMGDIFEKFYGFLSDESMITAGHVVDNSWKIARAKPEFQKKITDNLLKLENIPRDQECRSILLGKAILSFDKYFDEIQDKEEEVISMVKRQLDSPRNATKVKAERFLKKFAHAQNVV
jgi:hypothetical protein